MYELLRTKGRYALATMCVGGGQGIAVIFESLNRYLPTHSLAHLQAPVRESRLLFGACAWCAVPGMMLYPDGEVPAEFETMWRRN